MFILKKKITLIKLIFVIYLRVLFYLNSLSNGSSSLIKLISGLAWTNEFVVSSVISIVSLSKSSMLGNFQRLNKNNHTILLMLILKDIFVIHSSIETIRKGAFNGCSSLPRIIIPSSVTSIGCFAFYECSSLT